MGDNYFLLTNLLSEDEQKIKVYILTKGVDAAERDANIEKYSAWVKTLTE